MRCSPSSGRGASRGLGLIEFLVVMALLALVIALILRKVIGKQVDAEMKAAEAEMRLLAVEVSRIRWDRSDAGFETGQGGHLEATLREHASVPVDEILTDPWGRPYRLSCDGETLVVFTAGRDGKCGSPKHDRDNVEMTAAVSTGKGVVTHGGPPSRP